MGPTIAYLAEGKLYLAHDGAEPRLIESQFVQEMLDRAERNRERNSWKNDGLAWNLRPGAFMPLGGQIRPAEVRHIEFTSVARGHNSSEFFYAISADYVGGIFHYERNGDYERRLVHRNGLRVEDLSLHPTDRLLAMSLRNGDGTAHIATMEVDRRGIRNVTEGDSADEAPTWVPGKPMELIYQSSGIGRDNNGFYSALSPYALHRLDLASGAHEPIAQDDKQDYLLPRIDSAGRLLMIRRPYERFTQPSLLTTAADALLFPFRVVRIFVHLLHWMSIVFSGKPLISAGGPQNKGPAPEHMVLWGRMVQANRAIKSGVMGGTQTLVPSTWHLVARHDNGSEDVLAKHVIWFELADNGSIAYSDGKHIYHLAANGEKTCICDGKLIHKLAVIC